MFGLSAFIMSQTFRAPVEMEFPILNLLHLPGPASRIITQFLREPHPTAKLIHDLKFEWDVEGEYTFLYVSGQTLRPVNGWSCYPYRLLPLTPDLTIVGGWGILYISDHDGELLPYEP
jgi:hypothetical protein